MTEKTHTGLPVSGYQPQTEAKVALVNEFKADEERLLRKLDDLIKTTEHVDHPITGYPGADVCVYDPRWLSIARTHFQEGFMALNRAVFQPQRIRLPEDEPNNDELIDGIEPMGPETGTVAERAASLAKSGA